MAEKMSDAEIKKELLALGEESIGPITDTTRHLYIKKINRLKNENKKDKKSLLREKAGKKPLIGLSSDESDDNTDSQPTFSAKTRNVRSRLRSNVSTNISPPKRQTPKQEGIGNHKLNTSLRSTQHEKNSTNKKGLRKSIGRDTVDFRHNEDSYEDNPITKSFVMQASFDSTYREPTDLVDTSAYELNGDYQNEFSDSDREEPKLLHAKSPTSSYRHKDTSGFEKWYKERSQKQFLKRTDIGLKSRVRNTFSDQTGVMGTDGFKAKEVHQNSKCSQYISIFLLFAAILFFAGLALMYVRIQRVEDARHQESNLMICNPGETEDCYDKERVNNALKVVREMSSKLMEHAGRFECGYSDERKMPLLDLEIHLRKVFGKDFGKGKSFIFDSLLALELFIKNPNWNVQLFDRTNMETTKNAAVVYLEALEPNMGVICRIRRAVYRMGRVVLYSVLVVAVVVGLALYMRRRWRKQKLEQHQVFNLVEQIISILKDHSEACFTNKDLDPFVPIVHIRDQLIPMRERRKQARLWEKAVCFLSQNESRVREETQTIQGEDFLVWRWIQANANGGKYWQGQAFGDTDEAPPKPAFMPLSCLKIRNMFDVESEYGPDWHISIQDAILEKCGPAHGIVHIAVDRMSTEGCVYVKCNSKEAAGRAFYALHGSWFDSRLVTVKFLRLQRYHERFPEAAHLVQTLTPSNDKKKSLAQPAHKSFLERY